MIDFNILHGLSTELFSAPGVVNPDLIIEEGCWYLCTDTAELFLGVVDQDKFDLKKINASVTEQVVTGITKLEIIDGNLIATYADDTIADLGKVVDSVPTKLSELENDAGYITAAEVPKVDLSSYALKSEIPDVSGFIKSIPSEYITEAELNAKDYATESFVTNKIAEAELGGKEVDLSGYATKDDIKNFITEVPAEYITKTELDAEGYLKAQDISGKSDIGHTHDDLYDPKGAAAAVKNELLNGANAAYDTLKELGDLFESNKSALENLQTIASGKADAEHSHSEYLTSSALDGYLKTEDLGSQIPSEYITESELATELATKNYTTQQDVIDIIAEQAAKKEEVTEVKTKLEEEVLPTIQDVQDELIPILPAVKELTTTAATQEWVNEQGFITDISGKSDVGHTHTLSEIIDYEAPEVDDIPFKTDYFVTTPIGGFTAGESVRGLSVAELFAKLLGLVEQTDPTEAAIESIVTKIESAPEGEPVAVMQTITADGTLNEVQQEDVIIFDPSIADSPEASAEATESGFYQIKNEEGEVVESGFQEIQIMSDAVYYSIALPKEIDYNTMITVQAYTGLGATKSWQEIVKLDMHSSRDRYDHVVALCDEMGMSEDTIINLHNNGYTLWVAEEFPTGSMLRFVID